MRQVNAEIIPDLCLMLMIILFKLEIQTKRERSLGVRALMNVTDLRFENTEEAIGVQFDAGAVQCCCHIIAFLLRGANARIHPHSTHASPPPPRSKLKRA